MKVENAFYELYSLVITQQLKVVIQLRVIDTVPLDH